MKTFIILFIVIVFTTIGCTQTNNVAVTFTFTAVGDDGNVGQASFYDIRYATDTLVLIAWDSALQVVGEPDPSVSGMNENFQISVNLPESERTYYFAIRVGDDNNNWSGNSNTVLLISPDWTIPATIMNFQVRF